MSESSKWWTICAPPASISLGLLTEEIQENKRRRRHSLQRLQQAAAVAAQYQLKEQSLWEWQLADRQGPESRHQHDAVDRCAAGAAHHLHGDHAATPKGLEALVPQPPPPNAPPRDPDQIGPWSSSSTKTRR